MNNIKWLVLGIISYGILDLIVPEFKVIIDNSYFVGITTLSIAYYIYRRSK